MMSLLFSLALAAVSSDAAGTAAADAALTQPAKPAKPKKICERIETTGSSVPKKICRTVVPKVEKKSADAVATIPSGTATN